MSDPVTYTARDHVGVIAIDNPPANAIGVAVAKGLETNIRRASNDDGVQSIVVIGTGATFIAGADINEFGRIVRGEQPPLALLPLLTLIEDCPKPVVMALHGTAFGGGLETAMAGHYRVILRGALVGMPEVKLGLIPGAGGTQRLPRLAGVVKALEMCVLGEPVSAEDAVACGIADLMVDDNLLSNAIAFALRMVEQPIFKTRERNEKLSAANPNLFSVIREQSQLKHRSRRAPLAAIDAVEAATILPFDEGCRLEAELFEECLFSTESKALIHVFFGERAVAKIPGISKDIKPLPITKAAVIGAGTMGAGIAMTYANAAIPVLLKETTPEALERGMQSIRKNYQSTVNKGRLTPEMMQQRLSLITPQLNYDRFEECSIITEAVFESMSLKKQIFSEVDAVANPNCILATNTSSLDIDQMAAATTRPHMVLGTHFFSPANVMKLLEVVRGKATSDQVIVSAMALGKRLGKVAVLAGNCFGFIGNRMVDKYLRQAYALLEEGATVEQVNGALTDFGMAMGPLAMDDLAGIDVGYLIRQEAGQPQPALPEMLYKMGHFGQKAGRGWSLYDGNRKASPDPEVAALIAPVSPRNISTEEIVERCIGALTVEGHKILEEGIALRPVDIDLVYIYGYGYPAHKGGPMF